MHGILRRASTFNTDRIDHLYRDPHDLGARMFLHYGDLTDGSSLRRIIHKIQPDEIYNLGAQSHVKVSFEQAEYSADVVATGTLRLLEALRDYIAVTGRTVRVYQAGSSEMFGAAHPPQNETTAFLPAQPLCRKQGCGSLVLRQYREAYGMFVANGILFNHESPVRGETFVTRKITRAMGRIKMGLQKKLFLGNLDAKRDWGFAGDYVEAMWMMLQHSIPDDFVISTGEAYSVGVSGQAAASSGLDWHTFVEIDPRYVRPTEVDYLLGDLPKRGGSWDSSPKSISRNWSR